MAKTEDYFNPRKLPHRKLDFPLAVPRLLNQLLRGFTDLLPSMKQIAFLSLLALLSIVLAGCSTLGADKPCEDCCAPETQPTATSIPAPAK
jgi:hypothetical protein